MASREGLQGFIARFSFLKGRDAHLKELYNRRTVRRESEGALAQLARASALQAECQGFESLRLHQNPHGRVEETDLDGRIAQLVRARP